jgi:hypothetical protein
MTAFWVILGVMAWFALQFRDKARARWARRWVWIDRWVIALALQVCRDARFVWLQAREELLVRRARWQLR